MCMFSLYLLFSPCYDKRPHKSSLKKKGFILAHGWGGQHDNGSQWWLVTWRSSQEAEGHGGDAQLALSSY